MVSSLLLLWRSRELLGHQANLVYAGTLGDVDDLYDFVIKEFGAGVDKHGAIVASAENALQPRAEPGLIGDLLIDFDDARGIDTDNDCFSPLILADDGLRSYP